MYRPLSLCFLKGMVAFFRAFFYDNIIDFITKFSSCRGYHPLCNRQKEGLP